MPALLPSPLLASSAEAFEVSAADDDLRCPICFALLLVPRKLPGCGHTFCSPCIAFWLSVQKQAGLSPTCPIDRRVVGADEALEVDEDTERAVAALIVRCPNHRLGCTASFPLGDGSIHLSECAWRTVQCPHCGKPFSAAALARHVDQCFRRCGGCGCCVPRADQMTHEMTLCLARTHTPWWTASQASAFTIWRDATISQLDWLLPALQAGGSLAVFDWRRASEALRDLMDALAAVEGAEQRSAAYCRRLADECRQRGYRGAWLSLCSRVAQLEPASLDARLRCADALLALGLSGEARESYAAARLLDSDCIEAVAGEAMALHALGRESDAAPLYARARAAPPHSMPPQPEPRARWHVAVAWARAAVGDLGGAEELLLSHLGASDAVEVQSAYATVLELGYLADVPTDGPLAAAVPLPSASSEGQAQPTREPPRPVCPLLHLGLHRSSRFARSARAHSPPPPRHTPPSKATGVSSPPQIAPRLPRPRRLRELPPSFSRKRHQPLLSATAPPQARQACGRLRRVECRLASGASECQVRHSKMKTAPRDTHSALGTVVPP